MLGTQIAVMTQFTAAAAALWTLAGLLWLLLIYIFFAAITVAEKKPTLAATMDGSWLLVTVSTESLGVLGTFVASGVYLKLVLFSLVCAYFLGAMFSSSLSRSFCIAGCSRRSGRKLLVTERLDQYGCACDHNLSGSAVIGGR